MQRRDFIKGSAAGTASMVVVGAVGCGGKSVSGTVQLITGAIEELKILFPAVPLLDKVVALAKSFNAAWTAGKFDSARTFFENLDTTVQQVISDLGLNASTRVKLLLASVGIALRVIAAMIQEQGQANPAAVSAAQSTAPQTVNRVRQLANAGDADLILKAVQK